MNGDQPKVAVDRRTAIAMGIAASSLPLVPAYAQAAAATVPAPAGGAADLELLRTAWQNYNAAVDRARLAMEATPRFRDRTDHRAEAYYSLSEAQAMAYNFAVAPRLDHPTINTRTWYHDVHTLGGTSSDLYHVTALVDGKHTYRLHGRVGDLKVFVMQIFNTIFGGEGQKQLLNADLAKLADKDGNFEVILSATKHEGNWLPLDPNSVNLLFIRRFFDDWAGDKGALDIELLDGPIAQDDQDAATVARRIDMAADVLTFLVKKWNIGIYDIYLTKNGGQKNTIAVVPGTEIASDSAGSPSTIYSWGVFDLKEDEALVIEYDKPEAAFWSIQVQSVWTKPINYIDRQSDINSRNASVDRDGKVRFVISQADPGIANWLDPGGRKEGTIVARAYHARSTPSTPIVKIVKAKDVAKYLPKDTVRVSPAERKAALKLRREGILKMFGDS